MRRNWFANVFLAVIIILRFLVAVGRYGRAILRSPTASRFWAK